MLPPRVHATTALLALVSAAATQQPVAPSLAAKVLVDLVVPVHTLPADPVAGEYGVWAAGPRYKASFHDGFTFYPALGTAAPSHLPLSWHTESVAVGEQARSLGAGDVHWSGTHFERDFGALVEAYDVRRDGVEQTFTLRERPDVAGDLVITGRVATPLLCPARTAAHRELVFGDGARDVIGYGEACAVDAGGRRCTVLTAWDGERIRLSVPAAFVARAEFPLVVDPLITTIVLTTTTMSVLDPVVTAQPGTGGRILFAWSQAASSGDFDLYSVSCNRDFTGVTGVHYDITSSWSSDAVDASYVGGPAKWLVSQQRTFSTGRVARVYLQNVANTTLNSGTLVGPGVPFGLEDLAPVLGGSPFGNSALLVANRLHTASGASDVVAWRIDAATGVVGPIVTLTAGFLESLHTARVTPMVASSIGWVVAAIGSSGIRVAKVPSSVSGNVPTQLLVSASGETFEGTAGLPGLNVAGDDGRYLLAYVGIWPGPFGLVDRVRSVRFDWPGGAAGPNVIAARTHAVAAHGLVVSLRLGGIEYDPTTRSHWTVGYADFASGSNTVSRLGFTGAPVETQSTPGLCDVAFARAGGDGSFVLAYRAVALLTYVAYGSELGYPTDAISAAYGVSCAGPGVSVSTNRSYAGHEFYRVRLNGILPGAPAIYALSSAPGSFDLTGTGLPGCFLDIALPAMGTLTAVADATGLAEVVFALPDSPPFLGDVFSQWFYFDPAASPVPFRSYSGIKHQIR